VCPGFIDSHVHLTMDAADLARQTLASSAAKALKGLSIAREYMRYGFTTLRDMGCADPDFPTVDLRNALAAGLVEGPRLIVAAHIISSSAGHGDLCGFYGPRWDIPVSAIADDASAIKAHVRREHTSGSDWIKTTNTDGYFSPGSDPDRGHARDAAGRRHKGWSIDRAGRRRLRKSPATQLDHPAASHPERGGQSGGLCLHDPSLCHHRCRASSGRRVVDSIV